MATGVLAIPAAIIGLAYSYLLIKKTRLESRKTELEIIEKKRSLRAAESSASAGTMLEFQSSENKLLLLLIVRFVLLYLLLHSWGLIEDALGFLFTNFGILIGARKIALGFNVWSVIAIQTLETIPRVVYWIIFFALSWPLFKDANAALGLDVREYLRVRGHRPGQSTSEPARARTPVAKSDG